MKPQTTPAEPFKLRSKCGMLAMKQRTKITKRKKWPAWVFGICLKAGSINKMHKNGRPYYYPVWP